MTANETQGVQAQKAKPPHLFWALTEGRAVFELGSFMAVRGWLSRLPKGDGHPVLVLPGFMAGDTSTKPLRNLLRDLGYDAHAWGLGRNMRVNKDRLQAMVDVLDRIHTDTGRKVSIIGWSLGGVFARELAKLSPDKVRQVISLGSPIADDLNHTFVHHIFEAINGQVDERKIGLSDGSRASLPPVPCTSILSRSDGVVAWRGSVQEEGPQSENIVVHSSHCGMGVNPVVMIAIGDRLAQKEGEWYPFRPEGWRRFLFGGARLH
jgi:pimeloyl-ACP methyl ester carboxylesterase